MNLHICSITFRHELVSLSELIRFAADAGFAGIELWGAHAHALLNRGDNAVTAAADELKRSRMCIPMISDYIDYGDGVDCAAVEKWLRTIRLAQALGTDKIRIFAGNRSSDAVTGSQWRQAVAATGKLADLAARQGIYTVIETHPNSLADTLAATLRLLGGVAHPFVKLNLDFLHLSETGTEPLDAWRALAEAVVHGHLKNIDRMDRMSVFAPGNVYAPDGKREGLADLSAGAVRYEPVLAEICRDRPDFCASLEWFGPEPLAYLARERAWFARMGFVADNTHEVGERAIDSTMKTLYHKSVKSI